MEFLYIGKQMLLMLGTGFSAFVIAKGLFRSSLRLTPLEEAALLTPAGLGVLILLLFALGTLGFLSLGPVLGCVGLLLLLSAWRLKPRLRLGGLRTLRLRVTPLKILLLIATLIILTPIALVPLTPPHQSDEIRYHLPYALHFVEQGAIVPDLHLRYPFFTLNVNLLYSFALLIGDAVTTHFMHFMLGFLAALNLYALVRRLTDALTAYCSALLFLTLPTVLRLAASAYIDLGLACFTFAAVVCLSHCRSNAGRPLILCAGLLFGIALGSKYLALAYIPLLLAWAYYYSRSWRPPLLFMAVALAVGLPWYIYNAIHTGNPISPFAGEVFGYWPWRAEDMAGQISNFESRGFGKSPLELLMLPYNLVVHHWSFSTPSVPVVALAVFPSFFLIPWMDAKIKPFALLLLAALLLWFYSAQVFRYLAAFLPLWCFFSVWFLIWLLRLVGGTVLPRKALDISPWRLRTIAAGLVLLLLLILNFANRWLVFPDKARQLVAEREEFLAKRIREYGVIQHLLSTGVKNERIYQMNAGALLTYLRNNRVIGDYRGISSYNYFFDKYAQDSGGIIGELSAMGISFIAAKRDMLRQRKWSDWDDYMRSNLAIEYEDEHTVLFALASGRPRGFPPDYPRP